MLGVNFDRTASFQVHLTSVGNEISSLKIDFK